ncbi:hypothetical protein AHF37_04288 [Paragonimus kellicotti]|nr:hypothetical protein AHF37_04288 [Paragonimus kellicotti]
MVMKMAVLSFLSLLVTLDRVLVTCYGQNSHVVHATVRSAAPRFDLTSFSEVSELDICLTNVLNTTFKHWDMNSVISGGPRNVYVDQRWASVDFYMYGYVRKNPSYKLFQILWSISSRINNHSAGCDVTVEPESGIQKCCKFEFVHTYTGLSC